MIIPCQVDNPFNDQALKYARAVLNKSGARVTEKRLKLLALIYGNGNNHRHFMINDIIKDAKKYNIFISLATFYNTIRMLVDKGLLSEISLNLGQRMFDTDTSSHQHFYNIDSHEIFDIPHSVSLEKYLPLPKGTKIANIKLTVCIKNE